MTKNEATEEMSRYVKRRGVYSAKTYSAIVQLTASVREALADKANLGEVPAAERSGLRTSLYLLDEAIAKLSKTGKLAPGPQTDQALTFERYLDSATRYIPSWVKVAVALALGLGTMIGWKRIVVTVGEKIGKDHLTYAQGAAAELVAMGTIGAADVLGLPVSTTHVLSSGVAGTMAANRSGLQMETVRTLAMAWVLTLPVSMGLAAGIYWLLLSVMGSGSGAPLAAH
jgi:PiT family inorganic phosphate transporter